MSSGFCPTHRPGRGQIGFAASLQIRFALFMSIQNRFDSDKQISCYGYTIRRGGKVYKADIAGGSLKIYESRIIADLLLRRLPAAAWRQAIEVDNVLQKTSIGTAKRQASLIKARLKSTPPMLWELVRDGTKPVATQAVFAAAIAHSPLLRDFLLLHVRDRFRSGDLGLARSHWRTFVASCQDRDPEMSQWSASTTDKLGDTAFRILTEVGMLTESEKPTLQPVHYEPEILRCLQDQKLDEVLRAMQVFL